MMRSLAVALVLLPANLGAQSLAPVAAPPVQAATVIPPASAVVSQASAPQAIVLAPVPADMQVLRAGVAVPMRTMVPLTTKKKLLRTGERVPLEVAEAVRLNGQVVIPSGSPGMAEITSVRNKGMWGKSGAITARVLYVRVGDRQIRLTGTFDDKGKTGTGGVVASVALLPVAGFFTTGTSAQIPKGAPVGAFLDEDIPVMMAPSATPLQALAEPAAPTPAAVASTTPVASSVAGASASK